MCLLLLLVSLKGRWVSRRTGMLTYMYTYTFLLHPSSSVLYLVSEYHLRLLKLTRSVRRRHHKDNNTFTNIMSSTSSPLPPPDQPQGPQVSQSCISMLYLHTCQHPARRTVSRSSSCTYCRNVNSRPQSPGSKSENVTTNARGSNVGPCPGLRHHTVPLETKCPNCIELEEQDRYRRDYERVRREDIRWDIRRARVEREMQRLSERVGGRVSPPYLR